MRRLTVAGFWLLQFGLCNYVFRCEAQVFVSSSNHPVYVNRVYGFQVRLPSELNYRRTTPPNPDHGFTVQRPDSEKLWVDASYTDATSTKEEVTKQTEDCSVEERRQVTLGGMVATSLHFHCPANAYHEAYEERIVLTVRIVADRSPVRYQICLRTASGLIDTEGVNLFNKIVQGFRMTARSHGL